VDKGEENGVTIGKTKGRLTHFLIEPFVAHEIEYFLAFTSKRDADLIHFSPHGGVDIEEAWDTVVTLEVPVLGDITAPEIAAALPDVPNADTVASFIEALYRIYVDYHFTYLEFNPIAAVGDDLIPLDTVARLDDTAAFQCAEKWGDIEFPKPFGTALSEEEAYIASLDERTGASLKLTILNPDGRVWLMVAGGGASVIYADTVVDLMLRRVQRESLDRADLRIREDRPRIDDLLARPGGEAEVPADRRGDRQLHRRRQDVHRDHRGA